MTWLKISQHFAEQCPDYHDQKRSQVQPRYVAAHYCGYFRFYLKMAFIYIYLIIINYVSAQPKYRTVCSLGALADLEV